MGHRRGPRPAQTKEKHRSWSMRKGISRALTWVEKTLVHLSGWVSGASKTQAASFWSMQLGRGPNTSYKYPNCTDQICNGLTLNSGFLWSRSRALIFLHSSLCNSIFVVENIVVKTTSLSPWSQHWPRYCSLCPLCEVVTGWLVWVSLLSLRASGPSWPGAASYREPTNQDQERRQYDF